MNSFEKVLRFCATALIYFIPLVPLIVFSGTFFPYITGKNFTFRILVEIVTALWLILLLLRPSEYKPKKSFILYALGMFILAAGISTLVSANPYRSFWSNFERMEGYIGLLHSAAYFLILSIFLKKENFWQWFIHISIFGAVCVSLFGLLQHFAGIGVSGQGGVRIDGTFGNAIYLAGYAVFHTFLIAYVALKNKNLFLRFIYGLIGALFIFTMYLTQTRGAMLGLIGGIGVGLVLFAFSYGGKVRTTAITVLVAFSLLVGGLYIARGSAFVQKHEALKRFTNISLSEGTAKARFLIWNMAFQGIKERPVFGWGQENFSLVFNKYYNPQMYAQEQWFDRAHSVFIDWLVATGLFGFLAYLALYLTSFYYLLRGGSVFSRGERIVLSSLLVANIVQSLFVFDNLGGYLTFFMILAYMHAQVTTRQMINPATVSSPKQFRPNNTGNTTPHFLALIGVVGVVVGLGFSLYFFNIRPILSNRNLIRGITLLPTQPLSQNIDYFQKAIDYHAFGVSEIREQMLQSLFSVINASQFSSEEKIRLANLTVRELEAQVVATPYDARYQYFIGAMFRMFGEPKQAMPYLSKALELSPKKQAMAFEIISAFVDIGQYQEAEVLAEKTLALAPEFQQAQMVYAVVLLYNKQWDKLDKLFDPSVRPALAADTRVPQQFEALGEKARYQNILRRYISFLEANIRSNDSSNPNCSFMNYLVSHYQYLGQSSEKIQNLQKQFCAQ